MSLAILIIKFLVKIGRPALRLGLFVFDRLGFILAISLVMTVFYVGYILIGDLPNVNEIYNPPIMATKILDRNGDLLYKFYQNENRSWIPLSKIPKSLIEATLAIEDKEYFNHKGLSIKGIMQAILFDVFKKGDEDKLRGGSTITQQLVKGVFFSKDKTWKRKIKEALLSVMVETKLTKNEILERYLNQVAYGGETYGAQEASIKYFGKNITDINVAEAAFLAGLPAAPTSYSPFGNTPELGYLRQKHVIQEMLSAGFIDEKAAKEATEKQIIIKATKQDILAPHFVFYIKDYLIKQFGYENFERRGLIIKTSLDLKTQLMAEKIVREEVGAVEKMRISNGAAMVLNPKNGEILAMVGSKDYNSKKIDGKYNITTAIRQPGSSIKPINYLLALMKGWTLGSLIDDAYVTYQTDPKSKPYTPSNYNGKYMGKVTLRTALASSLNIPSVKILAQDGTNNMIDLAEKMGITTWKDRSRFGLALALGSGEVKMTELANAYSTFANLGSKTDLNPVLEIDNYLGEKIYESSPDQKQIVDPRLAFMINNVLSDNTARAPIFGLNSKLRIEGKTVAVKTGTTNSLKDNWCIGWTPSVLVAAWVGNNNSSPMSWVASGVSGATPIWNKIISELLKEKQDEKWEVPEGVYKASVCGKDEYYIGGLEKTVKCNNDLNKLTPTATN